MESKNLRFSVFKFILITTLVLNFSCAKKSTNDNNLEVIQTYLSDNYHQSINKNISKIFIFTENGCMACNKMFSNLMPKYFDDSSTLIFVNADGTKVDISSLKNHKNVLFCKNLGEKNDKIFKESKIIFMKNNKIDTLFNIEASKIDEQFKIINSRNQFK